MKNEKADDIKLFLDLALWFGEKRKMTVNQFLTWFTSYLSPDNKDYFQRIVPFFMEEQQSAERTLCELLERNYLQKKKIRTVGSKITRHVDWARTYAKAMPYIPIKYHGAEMQMQLDISLLGALVGIAREWKAWLEKIIAWSSESNWKETAEIKSIDGRARKLEKAIDHAKKRGAVTCSYALSPKHRQIILNFVKPEEKEAFLKSLNRWSDYSVKDLSSIMGKVERIIKEMICETKNLNNLFEATCHLSILKAVIDGNDGWKIVDIEIQQTKNSRKIAYVLQREDVFFKLGKGKPVHLFPLSEYARNYQNDRMLQIRVMAGQSGSGYEPDIVMGFYRKGHEDVPHVIFGDAKRYLNSAISGAYKSTIASTMVAYGHWGKLEIRSAANWEGAFWAPVNPFFTLFHVPNEINADAEKSIQEQLDTESPVVEITLKQMKSDEMTIWFQSLFKQTIEEVLEKTE